uniref:Uncharacterized protein n=1 Tax=Zea mays TaxID=4577 RepID=B6T847_MAIZE|nr:hypothetical protein [Zea mays]
MYFKTYKCFIHSNCNIFESISFVINSDDIYCNLVITCKCCNL